MSLHPYRGRHAVQSAGLVVVFHAPLDASSVSPERITRAHENLKPQMSQMNPIQAFTFQVGLGGTPAPVATPNTFMGWEFYSLAEPSKTGQVVERSAVVQEERIAITENNYDRWEHFKVLVNNVLDEISDFAFEKRELAYVALGYSDAFIWKDNPALADASCVFDKETKYLTKNVFELGSSLFHCNHGFFTTNESDDVGPFLDNINVSRVVGGENNYHVFVVNSEHRITPKKSLYGAEAKEFVVAHLEGLHARNKEMLGELLTTDVQAQIKLWGA